MLRLERVDIGRRADPAEFVEALDLLVAQPLDIHRAPRDEVLEPRHPLRRTDKAAGAAAHRFPRLPPGGAAAIGTGIGKDVRLRIGQARGEVDVPDLRDHVAGAVDLHPVAHPQVARADRIAGIVHARDIILVVQRRVGNDDAADRHGPKPRDGRERAGAAHVDVDRLEPGPSGLGRELMGNGPAGRRGAKAEPTLQREVVDLVDDAVDIVTQIGPRGLDGCIAFKKPVHPVAAPRLRVGLETERAQAIERVCLRPGQRFRQLAPGIRKKAQWTGRGDLRVELAETAGGGVARIGEGLGAGLRLPFIQSGEVGMVHIDLAPDLQHVGRAVERFGNVLDGPRVRRHVLAGLPVASRRGTDEPSRLVAQRKAQPVDLGLGRVAERSVRREVEEPADAGVELPDIALLECVAEREHPHLVPDLAKGLRRGRTDLFGRGIHTLECREAVLDREVPALGGVVFRVAHHRIVVAMIGGVGTREQIRETREFGLGRSRVERLDLDLRRVRQVSSPRSAPARVILRGFPG